MARYYHPGADEYADQLEAYLKQFRDHDSRFLVSVEGFMGAQLMSGYDVIDKLKALVAGARAIAERELTELVEWEPTLLAIVKVDDRDLLGLGTL